jgi:DNA-binding transcriptional MerR regulator
MMNQDFFSTQDLVRRLGVSEDEIAEWTEAKLFRPVGFADDRTPLYPSGTPERIAYIQKLAELGYGLEEILKIVKKVGLPQDQGSPKKVREKGGFLTVGSLADRSGVSPRTIKHWEDKGIIEPDMRTGGGFRLYSDSYVFICKLIRDLQLFGYTLEEIKAVSDDVRALLAIQADLEAFPKPEVDSRLDVMLGAIRTLQDKTAMLREGIERWEDLLKKKRKDIQSLKSKNMKRGESGRGGHDA